MAVRIPLLDGTEALISAADKHLALKPWRWSQGYVVCKVCVWDDAAKTNRWIVQRLHRLVFGEQAKHIYFKDGNPRNCQRDNLTEEYVNRPGKTTGRRAGDPANDGGWASRKKAKQLEQANCTV